MNLGFFHQKALLEKRFFTLHQQYEKQEEAFTQIAPVAITKAFMPITHFLEGDQYKVNNFKSLFKFSDIMHEDSLLETLQLLTPLSQDQINALINILEFIRPNWQQLPTNSILRHLLQYQLLDNTILGDKPDARVLEVGAGSGYLALFIKLLRPNSSIMLTDASQAHYLFQSLMYDHFEILDESILFDDPSLFSSFNSQRIMHIPWWQFFSLLETDVNGCFDVLVINHAICELSPLALKIVARVSQRLKIEKIFIEGLGLQRHSSTASEVFNTISGYGFNKINQIGRETFLISKASQVVSPRPRNEAPENIWRKLIRFIPFYPLLVDEFSRLAGLFKNLNHESGLPVKQVDSDAVLAQLNSVYGKFGIEHFLLYATTLERRISSGD